MPIDFVSYTETSGESSAEEADNARQLCEAFFCERDSMSTGKGGKGLYVISRSSNGGQVKSSVIGVLKFFVVRIFRLGGRVLFLGFC